MEYFSSLAFVLKKEPSGEQDRVYAFYTKNYGKLNLLAVGSQKLTARLSGHLERPALVWIKFILGHRPKLVSALEENNFLKIKKNQSALLSSLKILSFLDELTLEYQVDEKIWNLLFESFSFLEKNVSHGKTIADFVYFYFQSQLIKISGWEPYLKDCLICHQKANYFNFGQKGLLCQKHRKKDDLFLTESGLKSLQLLFNSSLKNFKTLNSLKEILKNKEVLEKFLSDFSFFLKSDIIG